jgi:glutamine synthetase
MYTHGHLLAGARRLPRNLLDAIRVFDQCAMPREAFGDAFVNSYVKLKYAEWDSYMHHMTQWEHDRTLDI